MHTPSVRCVRACVPMHIGFDNMHVVYCGVGSLIKVHRLTLVHILYLHVF